MLTVFGVRHHGPGSARSLRKALEELQPDCVLVEGPPDAGSVLSLLTHAAMQPPVALLAYVPEEPKRAVFYPFAEFSPEWQALQYALTGQVEVRFMDLPVAIRFAMDQQKEKDLEARLKEKEVQAGPAAGDEGNDDTDEPNLPENGDGDSGEDSACEAHPRYDPLRWLAEAAGYSDGERWWEHMVEQRRDSSDLFAAVLEAMGALRKELPPLKDPDRQREELLREAHMRQVIRAAQKEGARKIAVVCGAWHAPLLAGTLLEKKETPSAGTLETPSAKEDAALLKGLPRLKVAATWIPWTYGRLSQASGYGAGVVSPGWYAHLWRHRAHVAEHWLTRVAHLLREEDLDASAAQTIEAVRLSVALAAFRGRPLPGLEELNESVQTVFCFGSSLPMRLIHQRLIVGEVLGKVPDETPMVPLQQDLTREQKRLRLSPKALEEKLELDLRKENDLDRSRLLHRLSLLGIPWGRAERSRGKGTFKELWTLQWQPEFAVRVIESSRWGNSVPEAATAFARSEADQARDLPVLTELIDRVLLAELPQAASHVMERLQGMAAVTSDVGHLMDALPALANVLRYGNVRQTDSQAVAAVVAGLLARICIGLPPACGSLNDDAAGEVFERIGKVHAAVQLLQQEEQTGEWQAVLTRLADSPNPHGLIAGRCVRLLLDAGGFQHEDAARRLGLALSTANDPAMAAAWIEGFLRGSGALLLHDERLWALVDTWICTLKKDAFDAVLPLLRRTFSTFQMPERRQMGERVKRAGSGGQALAVIGSGDLDVARAEAVLPLVRRLLGLAEA